MLTKFVIMAMTWLRSSQGQNSGNGFGLKLKKHMSSAYIILKNAEKKRTLKREAEARKQENEEREEQGLPPRKGMSFLEGLKVGLRGY